MGQALHARRRGRPRSATPWPPTRRTSRRSPPTSRPASRRCAAAGILRGHRGRGLRGAGRRAAVPDPVAGPAAGAGPEGDAVSGAAGCGWCRRTGRRSAPTTSSRDGVITVFPEGHTDAADAPTLLIHYRDDQGFTPRPGREDWTVDDIVAYSKLCTHAGCPVGLYQAESGLLLCPCHQSTFDVIDGARPVFGPAARSLPQLPLGLDDDGLHHRHRRLLRPRRARASGTGAGERAMSPKGPRPERLLTHRIARWLDTRLGAAKFARSALNKVFPDHWSFMIGELGLYCFIVLVLTGVYLTFFFDPSPARGRLPRAATSRCAACEMTEAYRSALELSFDVRAGLVDAPDPPLGGAAVPGVDRRAPGPRVLHRRLPPPSRAQLDHRLHAADPRHASTGCSGTRCSTTSSRAPGCASCTRSRCRSRSSARGWRRCCSAASSRAPTSSSGSTSSTS